MSLPNPSLIQRFRRNIGAVRPSYRPAVKEKSLEILLVLERLEDGTIEPLAEINCPLRVIVERKMDPITIPILGPNHRWQETHKITLLQRFNLFQRVS